MGELRIRTTIKAFGPAAAIFLDDAQVTELGGPRNPPVVVTIGDRSARLRVARMGGRNALGLSKAARADLAVEAGDEVDAVIALDQAERTVDVPPALAAALDADPAARAAWDRLSYTHRKEHARAIADAKQEATRERRVAKALAMLRG